MANVLTLGHFSVMSSFLRFCIIFLGAQIVSYYSTLWIISELEQNEVLMSGTLYPKFLIMIFIFHKLAMYSISRFWTVKEACYVIDSQPWVFFVLYIIAPALLYNFTEIMEDYYFIPASMFVITGWVVSLTTTVRIKTLLEKE
jgi:hypothetical protein